MMMHTIVSLCHIQRWSSENHSDRISTMSQKIPDQIYFSFISILYPLHMIESIKTFIFNMKMMGRVCKNYSAVSVWRGSMPHKALSSIDNKMTTHRVNTTSCWMRQAVDKLMSWWIDDTCGKGCDRRCEQGKDHSWTFHGGAGILGTKIKINKGIKEFKVRERNIDFGLFVSAFFHSTWCKRYLDNVPAPLESSTVHARVP